MALGEDECARNPSAAGAKVHASYRGGVPVEWEDGHDSSTYGGDLERRLAQHSQDTHVIRDRPCRTFTTARYQGLQGSSGRLILDNEV